MWQTRFVRIVVVAVLGTVGPLAAKAQNTDEIAALNQQVAQLYDQGRYTEATTTAEHALALAERALGPEHSDTLRSVSDLARLYLVQGRDGEAEPLLKRALAGRERTLEPEHPDTLGSVGSLGVAYLAQGRYREAEALLTRAHAGLERALGQEHPDTLTSIFNLAVLYQAQTSYGEAEAFYKRAHAGFERALGSEHRDTLTSLNGLAALYQERHRYGEAEALYKRALAGRERALGPEHPDTLGSVHSLGWLYEAQCSYDEADARYKRALAQYGQARGPEDLDMHEPRCRHGEAALLYQRALAGFERALGPEHPDTLTSMDDLAELYFAQRDWPHAAAVWRRSTAVIAARTQRGVEAAHQSLTGKKITEAERGRGSRRFGGIIKAAYRLTPEGSTPDAALEREMFQTAQWALSSKAAQSLALMAARSAKGDGALTMLIRERQDLVAEWQKRELLRNAALGQEAAKRDTKAEAENETRMAAIDARIAAIDKRVAAEFPDYTALASPGPLSVEEVQAQLGANEALVLFLDMLGWGPTPEETFIWVVTKTEMRWVRSDLGEGALDREVHTLRCGLDYTGWQGSFCLHLMHARSGADYLAGTPLPFDHARAHRLYKALFGAVEDLIKGKHLLIVPSGRLTQLPFQVLITAPPASGDHRAAAWLVRKHALTILPAVSSLKALRRVGRPSTAPKPLIGFGNPLLDGADERYAQSAKLARETQSCPQSLRQRVAALFGLRDGVVPLEMRGGLVDVAQIRKMAPLPETADELCTVARDIGADVAEVRLGAKATEREVKAMSARGELAQYRIVHFATHGAMAGELSEDVEPGLILTPPQVASEDDDGYLSAAEIAALKLDADWVILSACNTAAGNARDAEALSGLARTFFYAQARALLVSHWAVDSDATVKLITGAVREVARDETVGRAESLRRAMLALIDRGKAHEAHPTYWAPFILVGEGGR